jgi:hypothetical protein
MATPQAPTGAGFVAASTAAEVIAGCDLTGKTVIVPGGYSGIGVETVRAFRSARARVVGPARYMPDVHPKIMDLLDPGSIDAFAEQFLGTILKNCKNRLLTRAARNDPRMFAASYRAATVRERSCQPLFQHAALGVAPDSTDQGRVRLFSVHPGGIVIRYTSEARTDASEIIDRTVTARNCMTCDRVQRIPLPRGDCGSSASS